MWKVGDLASSTGLTVRTLHHWGRIGLIPPTTRTAAGHRLYDEDTVRRLYQVVALRELGLPLETIRSVLDGESDLLGDVLGRHLAQVDAQLATLRRLRHQLGVVVSAAESSSPAPSELLELINEVSRMHEIVNQYFTQAQLTELTARQEQAGSATVAAVEAEWPDLIAKVRAEMTAGTEPGHPRVQALATRWMELLEAFDGGDPELRAANMRMRAEHQQEVEKAGGPAQDVIDYVTQANQARQE